MKMNFECQGSEEIKHPRPENIKCPFCSGEAEIWTDEIEGAARIAKRVLSFSEELLKKEKADWHIVIPASILHDVGGRK